LHLFILYFRGGVEEARKENKRRYKLGNENDLLVTRGVSEAD